MRLFLEHFYDESFEYLCSHKKQLRLWTNGKIGAFLSERRSVRQSAGWGEEGRDLDHAVSGAQSTHTYVQRALRPGRALKSFLFLWPGFLLHQQQLIHFLKAKIQMNNF